MSHSTPMFPRSGSSTCETLSGSQFASTPGTLSGRTARWSSWSPGHSSSLMGAGGWMPSTVSASGPHSRPSPPVSTHTLRFWPESWSRQASLMIHSLHFGVCAWHALQVLGRVCFCHHALAGLSLTPQLPSCQFSGPLARWENTPMPPVGSLVIVSRTFMVRVGGLCVLEIIKVTFGTL